MVPLVKLGVREFAFREEDDDPAVLSARITDARMYSVAEMVLAELKDLVPDHLEPFLRELVLVARDPVGPGDAARLYIRHVNTLRAHLEAAGLPPVNKLIVWARFFNVAHLLEDPGRSVENVAHTLEFPSLSALRNQLRRYMGASPREVRRRGGLGFVAGEFRARWRAGRWELIHPPTAGERTRASQRRAGE